MQDLASYPKVWVNEIGAFKKNKKQKTSDKFTTTANQ